MEFNFKNGSIKAYV
ncbi:hypothetical protein [Borreliella turdi]